MEVDMGTNYYLQEKVCDHCGRRGHRMHIGKSSMGWCFALHVRKSPDWWDEDDSDDDRLKLPSDLLGWTVLFADTRYEIVDEYGRKISAVEMYQTIADRGSREPREDAGYQAHGYRDLEHFLASNHAQVGPNNLLRHRILEGHCIGHGNGTYDLITGEFS